MLILWEEEDEEDEGEEVEEREGEARRWRRPSISGLDELSWWDATGLKMRKPP